MQQLSDADIFKIIHWIVGRLRYPEHIQVEDLVQEGWTAALSACGSFLPDKGTKLSSWIIICVDGRLRTYIESECRRTRGSSLDEGMASSQEVSTTVGDKIDGEIFCQWMSLCLSPKANRLLQLKIQQYPRRVEKDETASELGVTLLDLENLYTELRCTTRALKTATA